jgi:hypothetical protein
VRRADALRAGSVLTAAGEFAFVLIPLGGSLGVLDARQASILTAIAAITIDRPARRNALDLDERAQVIRITRTRTRDGTRSLGDRVAVAASTEFLRTLGSAVRAWLALLYLGIEKARRDCRAFDFQIRNDRAKLPPPKKTSVPHPDVVAAVSLSDLFAAPPASLLSHCARI